jgi:hypothetical protein
VDRNAPVEVSGQLNPFRQDRFLDIKARVNDVDLTGMSPYAGRFVGYGIDKGKLSMNLTYRIRDRKLTAENHVFLDQLTFGRHVDSPDATKLPVLLAVALLKDGKGVIDINLPISGTLDDPEFSVGGIIVRVIVNLLTKAVTAPFALIGSLFGGGEELAFGEFDPGLASLTPATEEKLKSLARALNDRPGLKLEITGRTDTEKDAAGLKRAVLDGKLRAAKAQAMVKRGEPVGAVDQLKITPDEYAQLMSEIYGNERFDKPRNAIGFAKSLPTAEMEKLILANTVAADPELLSLANRRAQTVRNWLIDQGKVPSERIFILNARMSADEKENSARQSRVDFSLK